MLTMTTCNNKSASSIPQKARRTISNVYNVYNTFFSVEVLIYDSEGTLQMTKKKNVTECQR